MRRACVERVCFESVCEVFFFLFSGLQFFSAWVEASVVCLLCACFCEFSLSLLSGLQYFSAWVEGWVFCFLDCAFPLVFPWCWFFLSRFPVLLCLFPFLFVSFCLPCQFSRY